MNTWDEIKRLALVPLLYLGINPKVVLVLFALMAIDMCVGTFKSIIFGEEFSLKKFCFGYLSKLLILLLPLTIALMGKGLERDFKPFVDLTMWVLIVNDGLSIIRNLTSIRTRKNLKSQDLVTKLLHYLSGRMILIYDLILEAINRKKGK